MKTHVRGRCEVRRTRARLLAVLAVVALAAAGCGSGKDDGSGTASSVQEGFSVSVASFDLAVGPKRRLLVGLQAIDGQLVNYGTVTMRLAYLGTQSQTVTATPTISVTGTYLPVPGTPAPPLEARPQVKAPSEARGVYAAEVDFDKPGFWGVEVQADLEGTGPRNGTTQFEVLPKHLVPDVGDPAPRTDNLTLSSKGVPPAALDSRAQGGVRVPNRQLHQTTIAAALKAHHPAVVVFATPVYCTSQFCGPVTDMVAQVATKYAARADFIHVEIWRDFQKKEVNKAAAEWIYRGDNINEPWVFVIGEDGRIAARFDNVATQAELEALIERLPAHK
jgi:hypothetical protein